MGNRSGCSLFSEGGASVGDSSRLRSSDDRIFWLDGLTQDENKFIKDLYTDLNLSCKESTILELKRGIELQMVFMRKKKRVTRKLQEIFDYIEVTLKKDIHTRIKYRITLQEFYQLWDSALKEKIQEDLIEISDRQSSLMEGSSQQSTIKNRFSCIDCLTCSGRDKLPQTSIIDLSQQIRLSNSLKNQKEYIQKMKSEQRRSARMSTSSNDSKISLINSPLPKLTSNSDSTSVEKSDQESIISQYKTQRLSAQTPMTMRDSLQTFTKL